MGKKILFCLVGLLCLFSLEGQNEIRIKGREPLPYVSIIVKGTTTGAATDLDGRFSLTVPSSAS